MKIDLTFSHFDYISLSQRNKTADEAEAVVKLENDRMVEELNEQLQSQLDQTLSKKAREAIDAEKHVIEVEHKQASSEAAQVTSFSLLFRHARNIYYVL